MQVPHFAEGSHFRAKEVAHRYQLMRRDSKSVYSRLAETDHRTDGATDNREASLDLSSA